MPEILPDFDIDAEEMEYIKKDVREFLRNGGVQILFLNLVLAVLALWFETLWLYVVAVPLSVFFFVLPFLLRSSRKRNVMTVAVIAYIELMFVAMLVFEIL